MNREKQSCYFKDKMKKTGGKKSFNEINKNK